MASSREGAAGSRGASPQRCALWLLVAASSLWAAAARSQDRAAPAPRQAAVLTLLPQPEAARDAPAEEDERAKLPTISFEQLLRRAKSDPPAVLSARAALQRAQADRSVAKGQWLPSLTGQATYGYAYDNRLVLPNTPRINSESLEARGSLSVEWSALNVARGERSDAAVASEHAAEFALESAQRRAMLAAAELFFDASAAAELVDDAGLSLRRRIDQHRATVDLVEAGTRSPVDVQRAKIEVVSARYMLQERKSEERAALAALASALGRAPDDLVRPASGRPQLPDGHAPQEATRLAQAHRPELLQASAQVQAAQRSHAAARAQRLPTLGALATGSISYLDVRRGQGIDGTQFDGAVSLIMRFQGLDPAVWLKADAEEAAAVQAERAQAQLRHQVRAEAASAAHELERAQIELQRARAVLEAAEVAREAQNGRYLAGLSSLLELLDAEDLEQQARQRRIEARRDQALAQVRLLAACGLLGR